jgi:hypothetical protein
MPVYAVRLDGKGESLAVDVVVLAVEAYGAAGVALEGSR